MTGKEIVTNRRAYHDYDIEETFEAGIVLTGTEIKAIRDTGASLAEAYVKPLQGELWLIASTIQPYRYGNIHNHEEKRDRKLLMHKREIEKIRRSLQEKGYTLVPLSFRFVKGRVKVKLGLGKGKKAFDKRAVIKERDEKRRMQKILKNQKDD